MSECIWLKYNINCARIFTPLLTEEGLCFAFNTLNSSDLYTEEYATNFHNRKFSFYSNWGEKSFKNAYTYRMAPGMMTVKDIRSVSNWSLENGYTNTNERHHRRFYPIRVFNARRNVALFFFLNIYEQDIEYVCRVVKGFKIFLTTPGEVIRSSLPSFRVSLFEQVEISVKATMMTTSLGLRSYKPSQRQCLFESERRLRFFKIYTQNNCELECLANFTLAKCGCVKFSMPRESRLFC